MSPKNYNNLFTSGSWSNKDPKDDHILDLVGVAQNIADNSKKESEKSNRNWTKREPDYIRDLPTWILEEPKGGVEKPPTMVNNIGFCKEHRVGKGQWVHHKPEDHGRWTITSSRGGGSTTSSRKGDTGKYMTLTKDLKAGLLDIKDQNDAQTFLYQFNINAQENK